jgi:hypothetical protein
MAIQLLLPLAQGSPGIFLLPFLGLTLLGFLCGTIGLVVRLIFFRYKTANVLGTIAIVSGFVSPLLLLVIFGKEIFPVVYIFAASPLIPGFGSLRFRAQRRPERRGFPLD